ncbi:F-box domain containing protein [Pandoravirus celtis]|uniref:F-box domain containing protein n=1 Tax=Pandoravirus celtis TaxID=2568002 RepID=A0A4D6EFL9_9VIRU|nr:F-box domain containing protein [Pandoravirus celtis]
MKSATRRSCNRPSSSFSAFPRAPPPFVYALLSAEASSPKGENQKGEKEKRRRLADRMTMRRGSAGTLGLWSSLPDELTLAILSACDSVETVAAACLVCRDWGRVGHDALVVVAARWAQALLAPRDGGDPKDQACAVVCSAVALDKPHRLILLLDALPDFTLRRASPTGPSSRRAGMRASRAPTSRRGSPCRARTTPSMAATCRRATACWPLPWVAAPCNASRHLPRGTPRSAAHAKHSCGRPCGRRRAPGAFAPTGRGRGAAKTTCGTRWPIFRLSTAPDSSMPCSRCPSKALRRGRMHTTAARAPHRHRPHARQPGPLLARPARDELIAWAAAMMGRFVRAGYGADDLVVGPDPNASRTERQFLALRCAECNLMVAPFIRPSWRHWATAALAATWTLPHTHCRRRHFCRQAMLWCLPRKTWPI